MPVSKHRKKGQTARQFRKKRNKRQAEWAFLEKTKHLGRMRAMQVMSDEFEKAKEKKEDG
jgi:hypothetical protein